MPWPSAVLYHWWPAPTNAASAARTSRWARNSTEDWPTVIASACMTPRIIWPRPWLSTCPAGRRLAYRRRPDSTATVTASCCASAFLMKSTSLFLGSGGSNDRVEEIDVCDCLPAVLRDAAARGFGRRWRVEIQGAGQRPDAREPL